MSLHISRRGFFQAAVAAAVSLLMPRFLFARRRPMFWFLHTATGESWTVDDPVSWALENARQPILERASERLVTLDSSHRQRIVRLVTRRCNLNLLEVHPGQVVVHFWGQQGQGNLRPFFKVHGLARKGVQVILIDRKREAKSIKHGPDFLYGERLFLPWPWSAYCVRAYRKKWERRHIEESDDWRAAPFSDSNYCWEGVERRSIPWRVLKSAWRNETAPLCANCDEPTVLISFGYFVCGFYKRGPIITRLYPLCQRQVEDRSPWDGPEWMQANLDEHCLPSWEINLLGKVDKSDLPWTPEGHAYEVKCRVVDCLNRIDRRSKYGSYYLCDQKVVLQRNNGMVMLPPFDGPEDYLEEWSRKIIRQMSG